ncbi:C/D box methylation guide ribonucleoprotein complex aNOP56 subunit [Candidatus Bathyarchaeota archaeon]|nr:MAG: C/D box methylation guide ribonucleoprotein complex aNOP56 subunit [Candidatus Bathyarchaeota archaeon]
MRLGAHEYWIKGSLEEKEMKITVITSIMGVLGFGEDGRIVDKILFEKDPRSIAEKLASVKAGEVIPELISLVKRLKRKSYAAFVFEDVSIAKMVESQLKVETMVVQQSSYGEGLRKDIERFAVEVGFVQRPELIRVLIREVSLELTRLRVKKAGEKRDLMVAQAILSIDDLDRTINLFMGRVREWYGLHFPELDRIIEKHETYAKLVVDLGERRNFTTENLEEVELREKVAVRLVEAAKRSLGAELRGNDVEQIQTLCRQILEMYSLRRTLQTYADSTVGEVAPNIQALVGSLLAARLIALAGGLERLAKMPSSTIQVLGAEKALFRALKTGAKPPKHGVIFQDTLIHASKKWQRGKISRALAGKLAIAARVDAFSGRFIGDSLKEDLKKRVDEIKEKYPKPPPKKAKARSQPTRRIRRTKRGRKR